MIRTVELKPGNALIIGGEPVWCGAPVLTWHQHGLEYKAKGPGARPRTKAIDLIVLHVTAAENPPPVVYRNLLRAKNTAGKVTPLGAEFFIDVDGVIWQCCDPCEVDTFDAGHVNDRSIGVEIVNYGFTRNAKLEALWGPLREKYDTQIHGRKITMARSNNAQHAAMLALCDALTTCARLSIPRRIPRDKHGRLIAGAMTRAEIADFRGVLGHFHLTTGKIDPGTDVFDTIDLAGGYG